MFNLPAELTLAILADLPLNSIAILTQVSRSWRSFINANRGAIYHKAAVWHGFIPLPSTSLGELGLWYSGRSLRGVNSWHDFCRRRLGIDKSWSAKSPSTITLHHATGMSVHRIKVDEKAGYILTTHSDGGLTVTDLDEDVVLWSLPPSHVRIYAHCEYGEGFIIFDRNDGSKEVWRRSSDCLPEEVSNIVPESRPTILISEFLSLAPPSASASPDPGTPTSNRGHFQPWAHLQMPERTRAFRFSYPIIGVSALNNIYLWDVRTGALVQTINTMSPFWSGGFLGDIHYIELGPRHVFLCGSRALRVFSRETGRSVLDVSSLQSTYGRLGYKIYSEERRACLQGAAVMQHETVVGERGKEQGAIVDQFMAVHVSSCGRHLAALLRSSKLIIIRDFERAVTENVPIYDLALEVQLGSQCFSSIYLAYENGRIAVATRTGIFIVKPDFSDPSPSPNITPVGNNLSNEKPENEQSQRENEITHPHVEIMRIPSLANRACLDRVSCLQMTDTGLFLNWDPDDLSDDEDEDNEDLFHLSLHDEPQYTDLAHNTRMILLDLNEDEEEVVDMVSSTVLSVDFTPL